MAEVHLTSEEAKTVQVASVTNTVFWLGVIGIFAWYKLNKQKKR